MKNIFFTLIMATSTALFALPSDSSMAIAQDSSSLKENVEAKTRNISRRHHSGSHNDDRGGRSGPTGPTGPAGSSAVQPIGSFYTVQTGLFQPVPFDSVITNSEEVELVQVPANNATGGFPGSAIAITKTGLYQVTFSASAIITGGANQFALELNGSTIGGSRIAIASTVGALHGTTIHVNIDAADLAAGLNGAALLQVVGSDAGGNLVNLATPTPGTVTASFSVTRINAVNTGT